MKTLKYGIKHIEGADKAKDLPTAMAQCAQSIVNALDSFNYNGKDPNLVLARVSSLEVDVAGLKAQSVVRGTVKRNPAATVTVNSSTYTNITSGYSDPQQSPGITFIANSGFRVSESGLYKVHLTFMAQANGGASLLGAIATKPAPVYADFIALSSGANVQSLCAVTLDDELQLEAGSVIYPFVLVSAGTATLNTAIGRFSVEKVAQ